MRRSPEQLFERLVQSVGLDGLAQMRVQPRLHAPLDVLVECVRCEGDDRDRLRIRAVHRADLSRRREAVLHRHPHVHEDRVVVALALLPEEIDRRLAVLGVIDFDLPHGQHHQHDLGVDRHILREQDAAALQLDVSLPGRLAFLLKCLPEFIHDIRREKRLRDKGVDAGLPRLLRHVVPVEGGEDDDRELMADDLPDPARRLDAVHAGHLPVDEDEVVGIVPRVLELDHADRLFAGGGGVAADADLPEDEPRVLAGHLVVVDDEHDDIVGGKLVRVLAAVLSSGGLQRHRHGEGRALALFALYFYVAVHQLHEALRDRHAEARAAEAARRRGILLRKCVKDPRQEILAHADAGVLHDELQRAVAVVAADLLGAETHAAALRRELDGISEDVDHDLPELHRVADVVAAEIVRDVASKGQTLVAALPADDRGHLLEDLPEGELLAVNDHAARLDAGHVKDVVDDAEKMMRGGPDLLKIIPRPVRDVRVA